MSSPLVHGVYADNPTEYAPTVYARSGSSSLQPSRQYEPCENNGGARLPQSVSVDVQEIDYITDRTLISCVMNSACSLTVVSVQTAESHRPVKLGNKT